MENRYFKDTDTLFAIAEKYPETIDVFVSQGFDHMRSAEKRKVFGAAIALKTALLLKRLNVDTFSQILVDRIEQQRNNVDAALNTVARDTQAGDLRVQGLLPCPVRIPLIERIREFADEYRKKYLVGLDYDLKAASMGLEWLKEQLLIQDNPDQLADLFISAGFDLFFDKNLMGKFKQDNVFVDSTGFTRLNPLFDNSSINLKDPAGHYSMIAVVPAIFLVNTEELHGRDVPRSWKDILHPQFAKSISLPIGDFDLFNAILLNIYKNYGEQGVTQLGRSLMRSMHPSQMVKSNKGKQDRPVVTIMPNFFTKMVREGGTMLGVWPEDGAIISPIFMLSKRSKIQQLQPAVDFFASQAVGEILAHKGLFPSIHPAVDNRLNPENKFMWLGWDYIYAHDIGSLIKTCEGIFNAATAQEKEL